MAVFGEGMLHLADKHRLFLKFLGQLVLVETKPMVFYCYDCADKYHPISGEISIFLKKGDNIYQEIRKITHCGPFIL